MQARSPSWRWICLGLADRLWLEQPQLASLPMRWRNVAARSCALFAIFEATHQLSARPSQSPCDPSEDHGAGFLSLVLNSRDSRLIGAGGQGNGLLGDLKFFAALADDVSEGR